MSKLNWCFKQKEGIRIIEPNDNVSKAFIQKAEGALESMNQMTNKDWQISTAYYSMYFSVYSILARIGVKCEIHSCTIELTNELLSDYLSEEEIEFLKDSAKARIDAQYYINRSVAEEQYKEMLKKAPKYLVKCKTINEQLTESKIKELRKELTKIKSSKN